MKNSWKRVASGALALAIVASNVTANVGTGGLFGSSTITASATEYTSTVNVADLHIGDVVKSGVTIDTGGQSSFYRFSLDGGASQYLNNNEGASLTFQSDVVVASFGDNEDDGCINFASFTDLSTANVTVTDSTYTGSALTPVVKVDNTTLTAGADYTYEVYDRATPSDTDVPIGNPTNAGTYYVKVTGIGAYTGTTFVEWTVNSANTELVPGNYEMLNSTYNAEDKSLVTLKENATSVVNVGTAQYAVGKNVNGTTVDAGSYSSYPIFASGLQKYKYYKPANGNFTVDFPMDYSLIVENDEPAKTYTPAENTSVSYKLDGENIKVICGESEDTYTAANAFIITDFDTNKKTITGKFISIDNDTVRIGYTSYYFPSWSPSIPTATDAGEYPVFVKVDADGNYSALTPTLLGTATIAKVTLNSNDLAAGGALVNGVPSQLTYTGEEQKVKLYYKNGGTYVPLTAGTDYDLDPDYPEGTPYDGYVVRSFATDVGDRYEVSIIPKGNYGVPAYSESNSLLVDWSIAKGTVQITKSPALAGADSPVIVDTELDYTAEDQALATAGTVGTDPGSETGELQGTMKYAATKKEAKKANVLYLDNIDEIQDGNIYSPTDVRGIFFPAGYSIKDKTTGTVYTDSSRLNFIYSSTSTYYFYNASNTNPVSGNAIRIESIDKDNKQITVSFVNYNEAYNTFIETLPWSTVIPQATDVGTYNVYYKVEGDANHKDIAAKLLGQVKIDYATSTLTLAETLGAAKVVEVDGSTETDLTANGGVYSITATKTYKIYTEKTISQDVVTKYKLSSGFDENEEDEYEYVYTLKVPVTPAEGGYVLSHNYNWTGKQYPNEPDVLYIADGEVTPDTRQKAATLKGQSTYYYGDTPSENDVEIEEGFKSIVQVDSVSFADSTGAVVTDLSAMEYGTYTLKAKILIDGNANGEFDDANVDSFVYISKEVEYKARPMEKNDYFVETPDGKLKLTVANGTVTVPEKYYVYSDMIGGSNSDEKYVATEKSDALSTIFGRCEEKQTFTYNGTEQKPTIIVKNGGNNADVVASIPATDTADAVAKDYIDGVKAETDAGDYSYTLTAETGTTEAPANYTGAITVKWTIGKADIQQYISVAPKNNVDTDEDEKNDAIVYDGAVLDSTDFEVTKSEAYANADDATKALVDEFIAQLTAAPATETTPAVAAKTTVDVAPAKVEKTTETEYEASDYTGAEGATINETNYSSFIGKIVNGNITVTAIDAQNGYMNFNKGENADYSTNSIGKSNINAESYNLVFSNNSLECNVNGPFGVKANDGYLLAIENIEIVDRSQVGLGKGYEITFKGVPAKTTTTSLADSDLKNANRDGEKKNAKVTVKNSNFEDVEFKDDNSIPVTIAKREVTITPKNVENKPFVYSTLVGTTDEEKAAFYNAYVTYDAEEQNDKTLTGLITGEDVDFSGAFQLVEDDDETEAVDGFVFGNRWANNAGDYEYELVEDFAGAPNYTVILDTDAEFVVSPKEITGDMFSLYYGSGDNKDKAYLDPYLYNSKEQGVYAKGVDKIKNDDVAIAADDFVADVNPENGMEVYGYDAEKSGVTVRADNVNEVESTKYVQLNKTLNGDEVAEDTKLTITVPTGSVIDKLVLTVSGDAIIADNVSNYLALPEGVTATVAGGKITVTPTDDTTTALTIGAADNKTVDITNVTVSYSDVKNLTANTDFQVVGALSGILPDTFYVGFKGLGNYTGVIADKLNAEDETQSGKQWQIEGIEIEPYFGVNYTYVEDDASTVTEQFQGYYYNGKSPEFRDDDSYAATDNKIFKFQLNGVYDYDFDNIDAKISQAETDLTNAQSQYDIDYYSGKIKELKGLKQFLKLNEDYKPELTYYKFKFTNAELKSRFAELPEGVQQSYKAQAQNNLGNNASTELIEARAFEYYKHDQITSFGEDKYEKLEEAPVDADIYWVKATFKADGFTFNGDEEYTTHGDSFEIRATELDLDDVFSGYTFKETFGDVKVDEDGKVSFDVADIYKKANADTLNEAAFAKALADEGYVLIKQEGALATVDDDGYRHQTFVVAKGSVSVDFKDTDLTNGYLNAGKYDFDVSNVEYGTVDVAYKSDGVGVDIKVGDEFTPTENLTPAYSAAFEVAKKKLTADMLTTSTALLGDDGVANLAGTVKPAEAYKDLMTADDIKIVGNQTTSNLGDATVQVAATADGNFTGSAKVKVEVVDSNKITVEAKTTVEDAANSKLRLTVNSAVDESVGKDIAKTGVIFYRGTECPEELTKESALSNADIFDFSLEGTTFTGTVKDSKGGVHYVGYAVLADGTVKYSDVVSTTISEEISNAVEVSPTTTVEDAANSKLRLTVNAETENASLVTKTGVIFYRGTECPEELTKESALSNADILDFSLEGTTFTGTVKDSKGGVHYVGYAVLADGTVKYSDVVSTKISDFLN